MEFLTREIDTAKEYLIYSNLTDGYDRGKYQETVRAYESIISLPDELDALKIADQEKIRGIKSYTDFGEK